MEEEFDVATFLDDFLMEAEEHLGTIDQLLITAERAAAAGKPVPADAITNLFRALHTLKGMAGMMGFTATTELAHEMEQTLEPAREAGKALDQAAWQQLTEGYERLCALVAGLKADGKEPTGEATTVAQGTTIEAGAQSIRVDTARLDRLLEIVGELVIYLTRVSRLTHDQGNQDLDECMQALHRVSDELQESALRTRMVPVAQLFSRFPRIVREVARECGKQARLEFFGTETELDKTVIEHIGDPLIHLVRNAVDHGLETPEARNKAGKPEEGVITMSASQEGPAVVITVADDGKGIDRKRVLAKARSLGWFGPEEEPSDADLHAVLFRPGFSTSEAVTNISGRGVGMDVVRANIQRLGGAIQVENEPGRGTRFVVRLPLTLVSAKALLARAGGRTLAIPLSSIVETIRLGPTQHWQLQGQDVLSVRDRVIPLLALERWLGAPERAPEEGRPAVIVSDGRRDHALMVDELIGQQDVVMKSLGDFLGAVPGVGGATILGDGHVAMIVDAASLVQTLAKEHS